MVTVVERTSQGASATGSKTVKAEVRDLESLRKIKVFSYETGDSVFVADQGRYFIWVSNSTFTVDNSSVILPNSYTKAASPIGRWIVEKRIEVESSAQLSTDKIASHTGTVLTKKTIEDLKKARVSVRRIGDGVKVTDLDTVFVWIPTSRLETDTVNVVLPNSYTKATFPIGRWIREGLSHRTGE